MNALLAGPLAGLTATVPMTAVMELLHRLLPEEERYPLPPREITEKVAEDAGVTPPPDEPTLRGLSLLTHFGFGTAAGAAYAALGRPAGLSGPLGGAAFGLAVWAASYLGWLPALKVLRPATEHPPRRTALMIAAHLVWGAAAGAAVDWLDGSGR